jgi:hypothetical protein
MANVRRNELRNSPWPGRALAGRHHTAPRFNVRQERARLVRFIGSVLIATVGPFRLALNYIF